MKAMTIAAVLERMRPHLHDSFLQQHREAKEGSGLAWGACSLLLFLVLGPFSVLAVLPALWHLASTDKVRNASSPALYQ